MVNMSRGEKFGINLAEIFLDGFHEGYKGTYDYDRVPLTYGTVTWVSDGAEDIPGVGTDYYDWEFAPFNRFPSETGWLELKIVEINEDEQWVDSEIEGYIGFPAVRLTFDEFNIYARQ